jgi:Flp pilus assembly protein TadG
MTRTHNERGSVAVELAVLAPALVALMLLVVYAGRVAHADGQVQRATSEAARAASLRQSPEAAAASAKSVAASNLEASSFICHDLDTEVDTTRFVPGGAVTVTVRCVASMREVTLLGVPGERTFVASSTEVIDRYRGGDG